MRSLLCVTVVALVGMLPASASAALRSSPVTHRALVAAERKFEQITPSHWRHGHVTCRRPHDARVWRCEAVVTGTHDYQGSFDMRVTRTSVRFTGYIVVAGLDG
jgi:hypothetical protein